MQVQINKTVKQVCLLQSYTQMPTLLNRFAWKRLATVQTDPQQLLVVAFSFMLHYCIAPDLNPSETATKVVLQSKSALFFTLFSYYTCEKWLQNPNTFLPTDYHSLKVQGKEQAPFTGRSAECLDPIGVAPSWLMSSPGDLGASRVPSNFQISWWVARSARQRGLSEMM